MLLLLLSRGGSSRLFNHGDRIICIHCFKWFEITSPFRKCVSGMMYSFHGELRRYVIIRIFVSLKICSFLHWVAIYVTKFVIYQYLCNKCWKKKTITYLSFIHRLTKINLPIYDKTNNKKAKGIVSAFLCMTTS